MPRDDDFGRSIAVQAPYVRSIFLPLSLLLASVLDASESTFPCPDEQSQELLQRVHELQVYPYDQADSGYAMVIERARKRPMDDLALHLACKALANKTFRSRCSDYGYECPHPGDDIVEWPADIDDWISALKANVPALRSCPDAYIAAGPRLPIVRFDPVLHSDIVDDKLTGWVMVKVNIDESGNVTDARVESSTSSRLEDSALEAARRFRYQPELRDSKFVASMNVRATIYFHYWHLAKVAGCPMGD
jgi:TonB family protein